MESVRQRRFQVLGPSASPLAALRFSARRPTCGQGEQHDDCKFNQSGQKLDDVRHHVHGQSPPFVRKATLPCTRSRRRACADGSTPGGARRRDLQIAAYKGIFAGRGMRFQRLSGMFPTAFRQAPDSAPTEIRQPDRAATKPVSRPRPSRPIGRPCAIMTSHGR